MDGLEDCDIGTKVGRRRKAEPADECGGEIREDVAVHVRRDDHLELLWPLDELVGAVVDDHVPRIDLGMLRSDVLEGALEQALGHLHDVGLGGTGDVRAILGLGQGVGGLDDLLAALAGDQLKRLGDVGGLHVLDTGVEILNVLAHHDEIDAAARVGGGHTGHLADGTNVGVGFEQLAERHVRTLLAKANGRGERSLEDHACLLDRGDRVVRDAGGKTLLEDFSAGLVDLPVDFDTRSVDNLACRLCNFRANTVAWNQRYCLRVLRHQNPLRTSPSEQHRRNPCKATETIRFLRESSPRASSRRSRARARCQHGARALDFACVDAAAGRDPNCFGDFFRFARAGGRCDP